MCDEIDNLKSKKEILEKQLEAEENVEKCLNLQRDISILLHKIQARKDRSRHFTSSMPEYYFPKITPRY